MQCMLYELELYKENKAENKYKKTVLSIIF